MPSHRWCETLGHASRHHKPELEKVPELRVVGWLTGGRLDPEASYLRVPALALLSPLSRSAQAVVAIGQRWGDPAAGCPDPWLGLMSIFYIFPHIAVPASIDPQMPLSSPKHPPAPHSY